MSARLLLRPQGGGAPAELPQRGRLIIGSDRERADYVLEGPGVEAVHCAIGRLKDGGWAIKDLGSEYGTLVNGAPATAARLAAGDVVVVDGLGTGSGVLTMMGKLREFDADRDMPFVLLVDGGEPELVSEAYDAGAAPRVRAGGGDGPGGLAAAVGGPTGGGRWPQLGIRWPRPYAA